MPQKGPPPARNSQLSTPQGGSGVEGFAAFAQKKAVQGFRVWGLGFRV